MANQQGSLDRIVTELEYVKRDIRRVEDSVKAVGEKLESQFVTFKDLAPVKQTADRAYNAIVFVVTTVMGLLIAGIVGYFLVFNR